MSHARMPRSRTAHLWSVVRDDHSVEPVAVQDRQYANHVNDAVIDEGFAIVRHLAGNSAKMEVGDLPLPAVTFIRFVHITVGHLRQGSYAELQGITPTRHKI